jgi:hypothetical protein
LSAEDAEIAEGWVVDFGGRPRFAGTAIDFRKLKNYFSAKDAKDAKKNKVASSLKIRHSARKRTAVSERNTPISEFFSVFSVFSGNKILLYSFFRGT